MDENKIKPAHNEICSAASSRGPKMSSSDKNQTHPLRKRKATPNNRQSGGPAEIRTPNSKHKSRKSFQLETPNAAASPITALARLLSIFNLESQRRTIKKKKKIHSGAPKFYEVRIKSSQVKKRRPARGDGPGPPASPSPAPQRSDQTSS